MQITNGRSSGSTKTIELKHLTVITLLFSPFFLWGQVYNLEGSVFFNEPYLEAAFVKENAIRKVTATIAFKDEGQPIKRKRSRWSFSFNKNGQLVNVHKLLDKGSWLDSVNLSIRYNESSKPIFRRERDLFGIHFYRFEYKQDGSLFREVYERPAAYKKNPKVVFFNTDFYGDTVTIVHFLNKLNLEFKQELRKFSSSALPLHYRDKRHITGTNTEKYWVYNDSNRLDSLIIEEYIPERKSHVFTYTYNSKGLLTQEDYLLNGKPKHHGEILYADGVPDAYLKRDEETKRITIIRFSYETGD